MSVISLLDEVSKYLVEAHSEETHNDSHTGFQGLNGNFYDPASVIIEYIHEIKSKLIVISKLENDFYNLFLGVKIQSELKKVISEISKNGVALKYSRELLTIFGDIYQEVAFIYWEQVKSNQLLNEFTNEIESKKASKRSNCNPHYVKAVD